MGWSIGEQDRFVGHILQEVKPVGLVLSYLQTWRGCIMRDGHDCQQECLWGMATSESEIWTKRWEDLCISSFMWPPSNNSDTMWNMHSASWMDTTNIPQLTHGMKWVRVLVMPALGGSYKQTASPLLISPKQTCGTLHHQTMLIMPHRDSTCLSMIQIWSPWQCLTNQQFIPSTQHKPIWTYGMPFYRQAVVNLLNPSKCIWFHFFWWPDTCSNSI